MYIVCYVSSTYDTPKYPLFGRPLGIKSEPKCITHIDIKNKSRWQVQQWHQHRLSSSHPSLKSVFFNPGCLLGDSTLGCFLCSQPSPDPNIIYKIHLQTFQNDVQMEPKLRNYGDNVTDKQGHVALSCRKGTTTKNAMFQAHTTPQKINDLGGLWASKVSPNASQTFTSTHKIK